MKSRHAHTDKQDGKRERNNQRWIEIKESKKTHTNKMNRNNQSINQDGKKENLDTHSHSHSQQERDE